LLSVGYRVNSKVATKFRQWATIVLKQHITEGYSINQKQLEKNKLQFIQTLEDLKILTRNNHQLKTSDVLTLIQSFSDTFFALESYDKNSFPTHGKKREIETSSKDYIKNRNSIRMKTRHVQIS